jgi:hypothetical protein
MTPPSRDKRDVRHYILTVGRDRKGAPIRETRELTRGTPTLLAFQDYAAIPDRHLNYIINDLLAERERRSSPTS